MTIQPQSQTVTAAGPVTPCCGMPYWGSPRRCTGCGHRQRAIDGTAPRQTREQAPWTWPLELVNRFRARAAR